MIPTNLQAIVDKAIKNENTSAVENNSVFEYAMALPIEQLKPFLKSLPHILLARIGYSHPELCDKLVGITPEERAARDAEELEEMADLAAAKATHARTHEGSGTACSNCIL